MNLQYEVATSIVNADLIAQMPTVPVRWSVPSPMPSQFIATFRVGNADGPEWADPAALDFHVYSGGVSDSPKFAHELAATLKNLLQTMPDRNNRVAKVRIDGEQYLADPVSGRPRVIVSASIVLRPR